MMQQLQYLSPHLQAEIRPMVERWQAFAPKLWARVEDVVAEANAGLDALIAQHATDYGPMGTAFGTLDARFRTLSDKVNEGGSKLEETIWEIMFRDGISPQDGQLLNQLHTAANRETEELRERVETRARQLQIDKSAAWARRLYELAMADLANPTPCTQCGGQLGVATFWQASNVTCSHCGAVNAHAPSAATYAYFGQGIHALAEHASSEAQQHEYRMKKVLDGFRHPTAYDHWQWMEATKHYWTSYYQHPQNLHPGFAATFGSIEAAVAAKLKHYTQYERPQEAQARDFLGHILDAARNGNEAGARQMAQQMPEGLDIGDCAEAAMERHDHNACALLLGIQYEMEDESDPRQAWIAEQLRELGETVRNR
jgi:hypothetical protein